MDNRVEVPTWVPGEGSESTAQEQEAEITSADAVEADDGLEAIDGPDVDDLEDVPGAEPEESEE